MRVSLSAFIPHESNWINSVTDIFMKEVCRLKEERGIAWTISYIKTCRNCVMRTLSGNSLKDIPGVALKDGYPTAFYSICRESEGNIDRIRILLTLFTSLRGITLPPNPDFSTIDSPYTGVDDITDSEILKVAHSLKLTNFYSNLEKKKLRSKPTSFCEFHSSTKNGPQGQAILNSSLEATLIPNTLLSDLKLIGGIKLAFHLDGLRRYYSTAGTIFAKIGQYILPLESKRKGSFRKIAYFSDKEGKTRIIAMLDYWSQCALRPLHILLNKMLRRIPNDCTFNQGNFLSLELNKTSNSYHSIDLTAATDRMPIALQKRVIGIFIGSELADAWERILIDHPFYLKRPDKVETTIKYVVGQPMGAYSSWPAMALTHHFLVRISALRAGLPASFSDYFLLGDDLVIANDSVAEQYKSLIAHLGMPYSKDKTHVSQHTFEFAKRWFHYGQEITGFPIGGLISTYHRYPLLAAFLSSQSERGWRLHEDLHPDLIRNIFKIMKEGHFYKRKVESSIKLYMIFLSLLEFKRRPEGGQVYEIFFQRISQIANPAHLLETFGSPKKAFIFLLIKAKYELLKSDLERIRKSSMHLDNYQNGWKRSIHDMAPGGMSRSNFGIKLTRHIGQVNRSPTLDPTSNPIQMVISSQMKLLYELVNPANFGSPHDLLPPEIIIDGLGRYNLTGELFSMRSSVSSALAESAITKKVIEAIVSGNYLLSDPSNMEVEAIMSNPNRSPEMAVLMSSVSQ